MLRRASTWFVAHEETAGQNNNKLTHNKLLEHEQKFKYMETNFLRKLCLVDLFFIYFLNYLFCIYFPDLCVFGKMCKLRRIKIEKFFGSFSCTWPQICEQHPIKISQVSERLHIFFLQYLGRSIMTMYCTVYCNSCQVINLPSRLHY